jgi:TRAP-type C4-dicarboxylate transport system permease small subunit
MDAARIKFVGVVEVLARWLAYFAAALTLAMSLWITFDVLGRNLFGLSAPWAFDLSEYSLVWMTFLAAPWVLLRDRHVRIEILVDAVPRAAQRILGILVSLVAIVTCGVLAWRTGIAAVDYYQNDIMMPRIWRIPRIWPYVVVPVGSAILMLAFVVRLIHYLTNSDPEGAFRAKEPVGQDAGTSGEI